VLPYNLEQTIFAAISNKMSELYTPHQIEKVILELNKQFACFVHIAEFNDKSYSKSSLTDLLIQRYMDELSGEWTTEKAYDQLKKALLKLGFKDSEIQMESKLNDLIPVQGRREMMKDWAIESGLELDVLKPNSIIYGLLTFLFFAFIPLGIGMDWFFSGIGMAVCAGGIFLLNKTARNFKMDTLGQMAESLAWKLYLQQQKKGTENSKHVVTDRVNRILETL
jgi:hypothetical protein